MITIQESLKTAKEQLSDITENPTLDAELLLAHVLQTSRSYLRAWPEKILNAEELNSFNQYVKRRCHKEPVAYITGEKEFWSLPLAVTKDTLIPRPETELLIECAL